MTHLLHGRDFPSKRTVALVVFVGLAMLWVAPMIASLVGSIDLSELSHPYLLISGFVVLDAVIPIFPSESLLTTGSNLAAQDGSSIEIWKLILAGSLGAVVGDSLLYWLSRTVLRDAMSARVDKLEENEKVARSLDVMRNSAPLLIVFGRFIPGVRFVLGATMGITRYPYPRFLLWDSIGGFFWAAYTCIFSYLIASVLDNKPIISIVMSVIVTTALLGLMYRPIKRSWEESHRLEVGDVSPEPG
ncbi:DedA family protein [Ilumatobacter sp.]|uniref:DedA family protein n=1 Tax=Ilumatobacter sp. TaxID=1967498 RepID=UPI003C655DB3